MLPRPSINSAQRLAHIHRHHPFGRAPCHKRFYRQGPAVCSRSSAPKPIFKSPRYAWSAWKTICCAVEIPLLPLSAIFSTVEASRLQLNHVVWSVILDGATCSYFKVETRWVWCIYGSIRFPILVLHSLRAVATRLETYQTCSLVINSIAGTVLKYFTPVSYRWIPRTDHMPPATYRLPFLLDRMLHPFTMKILADNNFCIFLFC